MIRHSESYFLPEVLVVEDDAIYRERVLIPQLTDHGFIPSGVGSAQEFLTRISGATPPPLIVLDIGLPDGDGFVLTDLLRELQPDIGIILLTGHVNLEDQIRILRRSADAYLTKPVEVSLLAATLHSVLRRVQHLQPFAPPSGRTWRVSDDGWLLSCPAGNRIALTRTERLLLHCLARSPGRVVTREQLIGSLTDNIHDYDPHRLESLLHRLRRKVHSASGRALPLRSVQGEGYILDFL
ncbi:response regulator transcription factor [Stenotrophomonas maltophilia]|uniref:response regulator transcription factor n=1 Tax=Stenotrophomonas maltophilia TaxID=40324 RepID=UPI0009BF84D8|nr:response regulator transcription factor [Stenotrophomonas maltophilia]